MRALLDANVYLSYLLSPASDTPPIIIVEAAFSGTYTLLLTAGVVRELRDKSENKPYLASRITEVQTDRLVQALGTVAEDIPELNPPFLKVGRDRKDDYLFAHAVLAQADFLVSGDRGVRGVGRIGNVQIVTPAEFLNVLAESG